MAPILSWRCFADWFAKRLGDRFGQRDQDLPGPRCREQAERGDRSRPRGGALGQIALIIGAWFAYSTARSLSGDDVVSAIHRGRVLQHWDKLLGFGFTQHLNHWVTHHGLFAVPLTMEYASLHYIVTPLVLVWLWRRHPETYRPALYALLTMSAVGLLVYIFLPTAPPRLLPDSGWIDTMSAWSHVGWWGSAASAPAGFENFTDQFAAMPSLHVGWAVWCAWAWRHAGGRLAGRIGWLYPTLVAVTVIVTANHYVLDVVAGAALAVTVCTYLPPQLARRSAARRRAAAVRAVAARRPGPQLGQLRPELHSVVDYVRSDAVRSDAVIDLRDDNTSEARPVS